MINVFRLHQKKLMLVITVLTIIAFIWLYNPSNLKELNANEVYTAYGKELTQADVQRQANRYYLARDLQQLDLIIDLAGMAQNENQMLEAFVWNLFVLQHESAQLGIEPTDAQVAERIQALPVFHTNGQFDYTKYAKFVGEKLGPRGFTEVQLEGVIRDALRLEILRKVIGAPVAVSEAEIAEAGRLLRKVDVQTVSFPIEAAREAVTVTEEEVKNVFAQNQNTPYFVAPETRAVEVVEFALPADAKPAEGKNVEALQKLANDAVEFSTKAASGDFGQAATAAGLTVIQTPEFDRNGVPRSGAEAAGLELSGLAPTAFLLSEQQPVSDPIQVGEKFYVAKLISVNPVRPMTFDEARPAIEAQVRAMKAAEVLRQNADAAIAKIREAMKGGKSFADAVAETGLKAESITGVSPMGATPDQQAIMRATLLMEPGQLSGFVPGTQGGYAVYLASRAPLDEAEVAKQKDEIVPGIEQGKRNLLFQSWLASAREAAKIGRVEHRK
jgi:peptidyl-prolyl cis-trans isomerase D